MESGIVVVLIWEALKNAGMIKCVRDMREGLYLFLSNARDVRDYLTMYVAAPKNRLRAG